MTTLLAAVIAVLAFGHALPKNKVDASGTCQTATPRPEWQQGALCPKLGE